MWEVPVSMMDTGLCTDFATMEFVIMIGQPNVYSCSVGGLVYWGRNSPPMSLRPSQQARGPSLSILLFSSTVAESRFGPWSQVVSVLRGAPPGNRGATQRPADWLPEESGRPAVSAALEDYWHQQKH